MKFSRFILAFGQSAGGVGVTGKAEFERDFLFVKFGLF